MKRVRDNKYVPTSAIGEQLNIFVIMCKYIMHIPAQSQQHNVDTKLCWALLWWPKEHLKIDLGSRCWDSVNGLLDHYLPFIKQIFITMGSFVSRLAWEQPIEKDSNIKTCFWIGSAQIKFCSATSENTRAATKFGILHWMFLKRTWNFAYKIWQFSAVRSWHLSQRLGIQKPKFTTNAAQT